jgi:hypothetical protein
MEAFSLWICLMEQREVEPLAFRIAKTSKVSFPIWVRCMGLHTFYDAAVN